MIFIMNRLLFIFSYTLFRRMETTNLPAGDREV